LLEVVWSIGVTGSFLVMGVTESFLVNRSYWKFSGDWELLEVVWSWRVTGIYLVMESFWVTLHDQTTSSNSQSPENFQ
jgi:hypothetical protein